MRGGYRVSLATSADAENLGPTRRAYALGGRLTIFHGDGLWVPDLPLASTLDTIGFHHTPPSD